MESTFLHNLIGGVPFQSRPRLVSISLNPKKSKITRLVSFLTKKVVKENSQRWKVILVKYVISIYVYVYLLNRT